MYLIIAFDFSNKELDKKVKELSDKNMDFQNSQRAVINLLEDIEKSKERSDGLAKDLEKFNIRWDTCQRIPYIDINNKKRTYTPEIYLLDYDIYLDSSVCLYGSLPSFLAFIAQLVPFLSPIIYPIFGLCFNPSSV